MQVFISPRAPQCETLFLESKRALYLVNTFEEFLYAYGGQRMQLGAWPQSCMRRLQCKTDNQVSFLRTGIGCHLSEDGDRERIVSGVLSLFDRVYL